jgi:hypothetical protein
MVLKIQSISITLRSHLYLQYSERDGSKGSSPQDTELTCREEEKKRLWALRSSMCDGIWRPYAATVYMSGFTPSFAVSDRTTTPGTDTETDGEAGAPETAEDPGPEGQRD